MALPNFPIDESYLVAAWLASAFWGAFTVIFAFWAVSTTTRSTDSRNNVTICAVLLMYTLATVHISLVLTRNIEAFINHVNDDGGAIMYLADIAQPLNRAKDLIYITMIVLADIIITWRCYLVWNKDNYVIALPCLMILATAVSGYGAIGQYFTPDPYTVTADKWAEGMLSVSMATNIIVTSLTAGRIWMLSRRFGGMSFGASTVKYRAITLLIIESGLIMTISKTMEFILFELSPDDGLNGLNALYIVMECMPQITGICPTLIILAVNRGLTTSGSEAYSKTGYVIKHENSSRRTNRLTPIKFVAKPDTTVQTDSTSSNPV